MSFDSAMVSMLIFICVLFTAVSRYGKLSTRYACSSHIGEMMRNLDGVCVGFHFFSLLVYLQ